MSIRIEIHKTVNKQVFFDAVEFRLKTILEKFNVVDELDFWDAGAWHLCAVDEESNKIVGYCRAIEYDWRIGFVTEQEFDLKNIPINKRKTLEFGRLVSSNTDSLESAIPKLLGGILYLAKSSEFKHIIGTASVLPSDYDVIYCRNYWREKYGYHLKDQGIVRNPYNESLNTSTEKSIPKLISLYEKIGAKIMSDPCWDDVFQVADFLIVLEMDNVNQRWVQKLIKS